MPFTVSHTAAVLPFSRYLNRAHLLSATVIGSMAPDFGVFLPWTLERYQTHGLHPLVTFCLPLGLLTYWLFQYLIKQPLVELVPDAVFLRWHAHARPAPITRISQWALAAVGVVLGTLSHLAWDGFTHEGARGVRWFPILDEPNVDFGGHAYYAYDILQLASSVVGLLIVFGFIAYAARSSPSHPVTVDRRLAPRQRRRWVWGSLAGAALLSVALFLAACYADLGSGRSVFLVGEAAIAALRATALTLIGVGALLQIRLRKIGPVEPQRGKTASMTAGLE